MEKRNRQQYLVYKCVFLVVGKLTCLSLNEIHFLLGQVDANGRTRYVFTSHCNCPF